MVILNFTKTLDLYKLEVFLPPKIARFFRNNKHWITQVEPFCDRTENETIWLLQYVALFSVSFHF